jgi:hypothetical protein
MRRNCFPSFLFFSCCRKDSCANSLQMQSNITRGMVCRDRLHTCFCVRSTRLRVGVSGRNNPPYAMVPYPAIYANTHKDAWIVNPGPRFTPSLNAHPHATIPYHHHVHAPPTHQMLLFDTPKLYQWWYLARYHTKYSSSCMIIKNVYFNIYFTLLSSFYELHCIYIYSYIYHHDR